MPRFHMIHYSGDTFMSLHKTQEDAAWIVNRNPDWATITEVHERATVHAIREAVADRMRVVKPDDGDILFLLSLNADLLRDGGELVIPAEAGPASEGGHGPRYNSYMKFHLRDEIISHTGVHFVTRFPTPQRDRMSLQLKQASALGQQMERFAAHHKIATGSGDLNTRLPENEDMERVFDHFDMRTTAQETGDMSNTHGNTRLDYIWTSDRDRRVVCRRMRVVRNNPDIHSDHDPVEAWIEVKR